MILSTQYNRAIFPEWLNGIPLLEYTPGFSKSLIDFIKYLFNRQMSTFLTVLGRRETGKTNWSLIILEILYYSLGFKHFATNIDILNDCGIGILHIDNLDALKEWCKSNRGRKLFIFDEIGRTVKRRSPMSSLNVKLISELQILRKYKLSIIACTIDAKYVDNAILGSDILDGSFVKPYRYDNPRKNQRIALYHDLLKNVNKTIDSIPPTTIAFDTWGTAIFTEHGESIKPTFKDAEESLMWDWTEGKTSADLEVSRMKIHRLSKKMTRLYLESKRNV